MKLFGLFGKDKPATFAQFRDHVRVAAANHYPGSQFKPTDTGFILTIDGKAIGCNLRNLYAEYCKTPGDRDALVNSWLASINPEVPEHTWSQARATLRPVLKNNDYIAMARTQMLKSTVPSHLPAMPFVGNLSAIVMRDLGTSLEGVTEKELMDWDVGFDEVMQEAVNNMNMRSFPPIANAFSASGSVIKADTTVEVGLTFSGDHLTASWLIMERLRDFISMRLESDYVVAVPSRTQLIAVRSDEPGLINSIRLSNRNIANQPYALTDQLFHVDASHTGGTVSLYQQEHVALDPHSVFAQKSGPEPPPVPQRKGPTLPLLSEPTGEYDGPTTTPWNRGAN